VPAKDAEPGADAFEVRLAPTPEAPGSARRLAGERLAGRIGAPAAADLDLVITELVSNAVEHGSGDVTVRVGLRADAVLVEVVDAGSASRPHVRADAGATGGWGLRIVDAVARRWGVYEGSTHVWAELPR
jgi:anti-sigma regulatory factor (Ser/Thr protein kinase)